MAVTLDEAKLAFPGVFTIYKNPSDFPGQIVMRLWFGPVADEGVVPFESIKDARIAARRCGACYCLGREQGDDPCIVESWI